MRRYNTDLLFELFRKHDGVYDKVRKEIKANNLKDLPHKGETIKLVAVKYDFASRLEKEREETAKKYEHENDKLDKQLLDITRAGILKYAQSLKNKKYISEFGLKILWEINWTVRGKATQITQNKNENIDSFLLDVTDAIDINNTEVIEDNEPINTESETEA